MRRRRQDDPLAGFTDVTSIARGSTATVLGARDATSGQPVAIKLLESLDGTTPDRASFEREVRALGAVSRHPNVVSLHRADLLPDGRPLLVLERCAGSLADRLVEEGPLPVRTVVGVGVALAGALETAHRAGIIHGDLKPSNVLVTRYGEVALADFGVAALRDAAAGAAVQPSGLTLLHAAPEVLAGAVATPASDVYSLASTLHELLTGQAPFVTTGEEDAETIRRRVLREPAPPVVVPRVPAELRGLLQRALAKEPGERPATPLELAQHLRAVERTVGWDPTPCRVGGADGGWRYPLDPGPIGSRRGRAAATTGLPPLHLGAPPLDDAAHAARHGRRAAPRHGPWSAPPVADPSPADDPPVDLPPPAADGAPEPAEPEPLWQETPRAPLHETITFGRAAPPAGPSAGSEDRGGRRRRFGRRRDGSDDARS